MTVTATRLNVAALGAGGDVSKIAAELAAPASTFVYKHQGSLAYVGEYVPYSLELCSPCNVLCRSDRVVP